MRLRFKEDPKEWRRAVLLGLIGPAAIIAILRWRGVVSLILLAGTLVVMALMALCAWVQPRWFRAYYRFATWLGFYTVQALGRIVLGAFFFVILTPFGWVMRLLGKDFLQLRSRRGQQSFWQKARQDSPLDSMF